jgi:hypothetical protein
VAVAAVVLTILRVSNPAATPAARARAEALPPAVPRIDLARLSAERAERPAGERDLFRFGPGSRGAGGADGDEELPEVRVPVPQLPQAGGPGDAAYGAAVAPTPPPLSLKYLGSVENRSGVKVAVLLTDRKEVLTGQAGELVANRYRIARIGLESVDLEDIGSGQSRRLPLRGN